MKTGTMIVVSSLFGLACNRVPANPPEPDPGEPVRTPAVIVETPEPVACTARMPRGAPLLIPDTAEWVVHVAPRALMQSPAFDLITPKLEQSSDWVATKNDILRPCGVELSNVDHVIAGFNAAEDFVAVITAPGIARPDVARCVIERLQANRANADGTGGTDGSGPSVVVVTPLPSDPSIPVIELPEGHALLFGDDMIALVTETWLDSVVVLSSCRGTPILATSFARPLNGLDLNAPVWLAGMPGPESMQFMDAMGLSSATVSSVALTLHLDERAVLRSHIQTTDSTNATTLSASMQAMLALMNSAMPVELKNVPSRIVIEAVNEQVHVGLTLLYDELRYIVSSM